MIEKGISSLELEAESETMVEVEEEEWIQEPRLVPTEVFEDEPVEKVEYRTVPEERSIPQVCTENYSIFSLIKLIEHFLNFFIG